MGGVFSKKPSKQSTVTDIERNILQLKLGRDQCKRKIKAYNNQLEQHKQMAKQLLHNGHKEKRFVETQMTKVDKQLDTLEQVIADVEQAQLNNVVLSSLEKGKTALEKINQAYPVELAQKIMEDSEEAAAYQQEISELVSGQLSGQDLEDVEKEFEEIVHLELPEIPDDELEQIKEAAGIEVKRKQSVHTDDLDLPDVPEGDVEPAKVKEKKRQAALAEA